MDHTARLSRRDVRVMEQLLCPGVEHGREADPGLQPAAGNREQGLGRSVKRAGQGRERGHDGRRGGVLPARLSSTLSVLLVWPPF